MTVQRKQQTVGDSVISYLEAGPADGATVLLVHGIPAGAELWRGVMELLSERGWHCLAPDLPGYGQTDIPLNGDYSVKGAATLLAAWIEQAQLNDIWLVGHDIGGGVSQVLVTLCEDCFNKLTLSNCITADTWPILEISLMIRMAKLGLFAPMAATGVFGSFMGRMGLYRSVSNRRLLTAEVVKRVFWDTKVSTREGRVKFQKLLSQLDPRQTMENMPALARITVPVELVWGLKDPNQPWDGPGQILREVFPQARICTLSHAGHFLQIDSTRAYADALLGES